MCHPAVPSQAPLNSWSRQSLVDVSKPQNDTLLPALTLA
jgi:hypothetical protein